MAERDFNMNNPANAKRKELFIRIAHECASILEKKYKVKRVYIIGSLVRGMLHQNSDIDLVVEGLPAKLYITALTEIYDRLLPGIEINLIPFEDAFDSLKEKTLKEGQLVYG